MSELVVEVVAADRKVWSGKASMVRARSMEGDLGILPGHTPLLGILVEGDIIVRRIDGETVTAAVDSGFLSVDHDRVTIVADSVTTSVN